MQNDSNTINLSRYPLMTIGEIAADMAEGKAASVTDFAKRSDNQGVFVFVETKMDEDGIFRVEPGLYVSVPEEGGANAFTVNDDVTEEELAMAIAASIASGMLCLGADPSFFIDGRKEEDELFSAINRAVESRTASVDPTESGSILRDAVGWILDQDEVTAA